MKSFNTLRAARHAASRLAISSRYISVPRFSRPFHATALLQKTETHILSDIGEGVKEVQIIQWFVEEGATVEEWAPLCEVQSDKASVEITSKYAGVIKKLHFERDAVVQVGDAMLDIEVEGEDDAEPEVEETETESKLADGHEEERSREKTQHEEQKETKQDVIAEEGQTEQRDTTEAEAPTPPKSSGKHANLATPAVRGLLKQHSLNITDIEGSGKGGRVMKEDVQRHVERQKQPKQPAAAASSKYTPPPNPALDAKQQETSQNLTPIQGAMFKSMTKSLQIPHFLYSDSINVTPLAAMRATLNARRDPETTPKLTYMPFVIKAVSLALNRFPLLNAKIDLADSSKPKLLMRSNHNIGVAMDTPGGLVVPVIKVVNARSIVSIAHELQRLAELGAAGKLKNEDLAGATITVSNIGNIGGGVVAPVILENQLAIMGMGKIKPTPVFGSDGKTVERADMLSTSWSADHRVVDGATMARMASLVQQYLERPELMMIDMS